MTVNRIKCLNNWDCEVQDPKYETLKERNFQINENIINEVRKIKIQNQRKSCLIEVGNFNRNSKTI